METTDERATQLAVETIGPRLETIPGLHRTGWRRLDLPGRVSVMQGISDLMLGHWGVRSVPVSSLPMPLLRYGKASEGTTYVAEWCLRLRNPLPAAMTAVHETRHQIQRKAALNPRDQQEQMWVPFYYPKDVLWLFGLDKENQRAVERDCRDFERAFLPAMRAATGVHAPRTPVGRAAQWALQSW